MQQSSESVFPNIDKISENSQNQQQRIHSVDGVEQPKLNRVVFFDLTSRNVEVVVNEIQKIGPQIKRGRF